MAFKAVTYTRQWIGHLGASPAVIDAIALEQVLNGLPCEVSLWVRKKQSKNPQEAVQEVWNYYWYRGETTKVTHTTRWPGEVPKRKQQQKENSNEKSYSKPIVNKQVTCFKCKQPGHYAQECTAETFILREAPKKNWTRFKGKTQSTNVRWLSIKDCQWKCELRWMYSHFDTK